MSAPLPRHRGRRHRAEGAGWKNALPPKNEPPRGPRMKSSFELCDQADAKRAADRRDPDDPRIARLRELLADDVLIERAWFELNVRAYRGRAAPATVEALMYDLRRGISALAEPAARRRLSELSEEQLCEVYARVQKFKRNVAPAWSETDADALLVLWRDLGQDV
jgi:hypothetical protein